MGKAKCVAEATTGTFADSRGFPALNLNVEWQVAVCRIAMRQPYVKNIVSGSMAEHLPHHRCAGRPCQRHPGGRASRECRSSAAEGGAVVSRIGSSTWSPRVALSSFLTFLT